jgi:hypothetical protein
MAGIILGVMAIMALVALNFVLDTTQWRRNRDRLSPNINVSPPRTVIVAPSQLSGLGYLPPDTDVVVGLHVAELLAEKQGRDVLSALLTAAGFQDSDLRRWIGLQMDDIDHILLGMKIQDRLIPRITLVVHTRQAYDANYIRSVLKVGRRNERGERTIHRFAQSEISLEAGIWFADERTLVFGLTPEDFDEVPLIPAADHRQLAPGLVSLFQPLKVGMQAWVVGLARDWGRFLGASSGPATFELPVAGLTKEARQSLAKIKEFAVWLEIREKIDLQFVIGMEDRGSAKQLYELPKDKISILGPEFQKWEEIHVQLLDDRLRGEAKISVSALEEMLRR